MSELSTRTTHIIAAEINSIKDQTRKLILNSSIEIGRRLVEAKSMLPHGEWGKWLKESVDYSQSTANNLMKIFEQYGANQLSLFGSEAKSQAFENLSYSQAVALLGVPIEEREQFIQEHDVENMSTRELQKTIKEKQELEKKLEIAKAEAERERIARESFQRQYEAHQKTIQELEFQLKEAEQAGNPEEINSLKRELSKAQIGFTYANDQIKKLEEELKKKPKEVPKIIEKVPDEIEKELADLRKKVSQQNNPAEIKFKVKFEALVSHFRELLENLEEVPESEREKYKGAIKGLLGKMGEKL